MAAIRRTIAPLALAAGVPPDRVDDLAVMASELMVNALVHADTPQPRIRVLEEADRLRVSVTDASHLQPRLAPRDGTRIGGNGLRVVDALADEWGVEVHDGLGKSVWFVVPRC